VNLANVMTTPAEMVEAQYPIAVHRQALLPGSGGQGGHSGGDGVVRAYEMLGDDTAFAAMLDRCEIAPYGLLGGADGRPYVLKRVTVDGNASIIPGRGHYRLMKGEKIIIETCGGGGYGKPASSQ
ncbi:MAG: hydantoinase B/oxoprolinase family protein, partial [Chromatiales bacterium]|nr:hydantoinase B/oxoprolinase family protein [Chromatiales bacterium]